MSKEQKRDELTEIIIKANEEWLKLYGRQHLHLEHKSEYIAAAVNNAGYRKQSGWISVDERLPEGNVRCLVAYTGRHGCGEPEDEFIDITSACNGKFDMNKIYHFELDDIKIKYWMPLPEAPKGGAE